jgi:hypothetical protein
LDVVRLINQAEKSSFHLWKLNILLGFVVPFNKRHNIKVAEIKNGEFVTVIPYKKKNFNHIKGIHACGLATVAEYASGLSILYRLDVKKYRLIMKSISVEYFYQAKMDAMAKVSKPNDFLSEGLDDVMDVKDEIKISDKVGNHLATATIVWQIKPWEKVKTNL